MRITLAVVGGSLALAAAIAGCSKCAVDCPADHEVPEGTCICRPLADAGAGDASDAADAAPDSATAMLATCDTQAVAGCAGGSMCIEGCPASRLPDAGLAPGVCSVPGRDTCGCGAVVDTCDTPGTTCLMPACCDFPGVCVTAAERAAICARPEGAHFDCG